VNGLLAIFTICSLTSVHFQQRTPTRASSTSHNADFPRWSRDDPWFWPSICLDTMNHVCPSKQNTGVHSKYKKAAGIVQESSSYVNNNFILQSFDNLRKVRSDFWNFQRCFTNLMAILKHVAPQGHEYVTRFHHYTCDWDYPDTPGSAISLAESYYPRLIQSRWDHWLRTRIWLRVSRPGAWHYCLATITYRCSRNEMELKKEETFWDTGAGGGISLDRETSASCW